MSEKTVEEIQNEKDILSNMTDKVMKFGKHTSEKKNLEGALKLSYIFIGILVFLNLILMFAVINVYGGRNVSVKIPPASLQDIELSFGSTRASKNVYELYADYASRVMGNVNYNNADKAYKDILQYASSQSYHKMRKAMAYQVKHIKDNLITQSFELRNVEVYKSKGMVVAKCTGYLSRKIGSKEVFEHMPYMFKLYMKSYMGNIEIVSLKSELNKSSGTARDLKKVENYEKDNKYINF